MAVAGLLMGLRGLGVNVGIRLYACFEMRCSQRCQYKELSLAGFRGTLLANLDLPDGMAIGRAVSHGYGWLARELNASDTCASSQEERKETECAAHPQHVRREPSQEGRHVPGAVGGASRSLISPRKVQSIVLAAGVHLSTDAIRLALEHHIDIALLDKHGEPYGRFWHARLGSTNRLRRRLLEIAEAEEGVVLAGEWVSTKIGQQAALLRDLARTRPDRTGELEDVAGRLEKMADVVAGLRGAAIDEHRGSIMGLEGVAGREYFAALSLALPERFRFKGRSRSPARDEFNALLNYAYGVLYSLVERACLLTGLDPCIGLLHTDNYNKPSLVYDLIELHRVHAERVVVNLFAARKVKQELFDQVDGGFRLNAEGRGLLLNSLNEYLDRMKQHGRRRLKIRDTIVYECQRLAGRLLRGLDDDREVDLSVFDLAAELGGVSSGPTRGSADARRSRRTRRRPIRPGPPVLPTTGPTGTGTAAEMPPHPGANGHAERPRPLGPEPMEVTPMLTWVLYDIVADRARNKAARACLQAGLYRVQKSVFLGTLDESRRDELAVVLEGLIDEDATRSTSSPCAGPTSPR